MQWFGPRKAGWYRKGSVPKREEGNDSTHGIEASQDHDDKEKREERREKREERREKREESPKEAARDPQMRA